MDQQDRLILWLHYGTELNYKLFEKIREEYFYLEEALEDVQKGNFGRFPEKMKEHVKSRLIEASKPGFMDRYCGWMDKKGVSILTSDAYNYPSLLKQIPDPPPVLFYRGQWEGDPQLPIALVGTRRCTEYGKEAARKFGKELAGAGATVVTGMATGIDGYGALGALECKEAEFPVMGVLGCGIDVVYPKGNEKLYEAVAARGCLMTEFLPKTPPLGRNFPIRNRIISGLSQGTIVVEAGEKSGASITAGLALEQGREVFALPGRISDPMSAGTNRMIRRGEARLITSVQEVLEEFGMDYGGEEVPVVNFKDLAPLEKQIYRLLSEGEKNEDELMEELDCPVGELISTLTAMTFSGIMKQLPGGVYALDTMAVRVVY